MSSCLEQERALGLMEVETASDWKGIKEHFWGSWKCSMASLWGWLHEVYIDICQNPLTNGFILLYVNMP